MNDEERKRESSPGDRLIREEYNGNHQQREQGTHPGVKMVRQQYSLILGFSYIKYVRSTLGLDSFKSSLLLQHQSLEAGSAPVMMIWAGAETQAKNTRRGDTISADWVLLSPYGGCVCKVI
ncbi:uncharacterized protein N7529_000422 [Penicillium soppii]|uniref:uncharacterized protein n=1 Tax=Penicillium soppii TaxID=69789 RepID=UPI002547EBE8|nr:uncharacterized protein N7529_000422 [Penicillium soppii]KAJ5881750.1 hypothetical protein N7529_000422 [Penicillium soppii]